MAGPSALAVYLGPVHVADLIEVRTRRLTLTYTDTAFERWPLNAPVLSVALPLRPGPFAPARVAAFLEGLLPEGEARTTIESRFGVRRGDRLGLLRAIGRDCAGAVVIQPPDDPPPDPAQGTLEAMSDTELADAVRSLPERPLGADHAVRVSLGGLQEKLLLARLPDGRWARPVGGHPSTHILKPGDARYAGIAGNEALCLRLARAVGSSTTDVEVIDVAGRQVLVVTRYDRRVDDEGEVERVHQEDMCQALAIDVSLGADRKYEEHGGPGLAGVAGILDEFAGGLDQLLRLLDATVLTAVVGNADAHGRNLSLLHGPPGPELAPLYDVISTLEYPTVHTPDGEQNVSTALAMHVNGRADLHGITVDDLVAEALTWGVVPELSRDRVEAFLGRVDDALADAARATPEAPPGVAERVAVRARALRSGRAAGDDAPR